LGHTYEEGEFKQKPPCRAGIRTAGKGKSTMLCEEKEKIENARGEGERVRSMQFKFRSLGKEGKELAPALKKKTLPFRGAGETASGKTNRERGYLSYPITHLKALTKITQLMAKTGG